LSDWNGKKEEKQQQLKTWWEAASLLAFNSGATARLLPNK
jgi:hypothetical protein